MKCNGNIYLGDRYSIFTGNLTNISFDSTEIPEHISSVQIVDLSSTELSFECDVDMNLLKSVIGIDFAQGTDMSCSMEFRNPYQVQKRRHKKKRINKKWAKRYGYVTKFENVRIKDCTLNRCNDFEVDFIGTPDFISNKEN